MANTIPVILPNPKLPTNTDGGSGMGGFSIVVITLIVVAVAAIIVVLFRRGIVYLPAK